MTKKVAKLKKLKAQQVDKVAAKKKTAAAEIIDHVAGDNRQAWERGESVETSFDESLIEANGLGANVGDIED